LTFDESVITSVIRLGVTASAADRFGGVVSVTPLHVVGPLSTWIENGAAVENAALRPTTRT
jgi:hypothetical protein